MRALFFVSVCVKMIAKIRVIFLIIQVTSAKSIEIDDEQGGDKCDDIAIIGAGIGGTYAGWRLRNDNKQITIYEFSNRIGGRFYTVNFPGIPDINVELGAMRFLPNKHVLMNKTIGKLGLNVTDFKLGSGPSPDTEMYLRGTHLRYDQLTTRKSPFRLNSVERKTPRQLKWEIYRNNTDVLTINVPDDQKMFNVKTLDGIPLYKQSVQSVFHKSISTEAQSYLRETFPFDTMETDMNAAFDLRTSPPSTRPRVAKTVESGFDSIPWGLLNGFLEASRRHSISFNRHLKSIKKRYDGNFALYFEPTVTDRRVNKKCAKKVLLAINRPSLEQLDWDALHQPLIREYLTQAIKDVPAAKYYFANDYPWWRQSQEYAQYVISDTLLSQTYDFGTSRFSNKSILQPMYIDDDVSMWAELVKRTRNGVNDADIWFTVDKEAIKITNKYLSEIFQMNVDSIPQPSHNIISIWNSYPYGGAWQKWMPGYKVSDVRHTMVKPSKYDDVFVACSGFDELYAVWSESALRTVEFALQYIRQSELTV